MLVRRNVCTHGRLYIHRRLYTQTPSTHTHIHTHTRVYAYIFTQALLQIDTETLLVTLGSDQQRFLDCALLFVFLLGKRPNMCLNSKQ